MCTFRNYLDIVDTCDNINVFVTGAPNKGFLEQSITSNDNPFLRSNVQAIKAHQMKKKGKGINVGVFLNLENEFHFEDS